MRAAHDPSEDSARFFEAQVELSESFESLEFLGPAEVRNRPRPRFRTGRLALGAIVLGLLLVLGGGALQKRYLKTNPFYFDPVGYLSLAQDLGREVEEQGRWAVAWAEWETGLFPGYTVPLILLAPDQLRHQTPHLLVVLPMVVAGLFLIGRAVLERWRDEGVAWAALLLTVSVPGYWHPTMGIGGFWLDLPAGFLAAGAVAALALWGSTGSRRWLVIFGLLAGWLATCRYVGTAYLLTVGLPFVVAGLWGRWRAGIKGGRLLGDLAVLIGSLAVFALPFLFWRLGSMIEHYAVKSFGYQGVWESVAFTYRSFVRLVGWPFFLGTALMAVVAAAASGRLGKEKWVGAFLPFWAANGVLIFLGFTTQIGKAWHAVQFQAPLWTFALFLFVPATGIRPGLARLTLRLPECLLRISLRTLVALAAVGFLAAGIGHGWALGSRTQIENLDRFAFHKELAAAIGKLPEEAVIGLYYENLDTEGARLAVEMRHRARREMRFAEQTPLYHLSSIWEVEYPGATAEELADQYLNAMDRHIDYAFVYSDPASVYRVRYAEFALFANPFSHTIAREAARHVRDSPEWEEVARISTPHYESVSIYRNKVRTPEPAAEEPDAG